MLSKASNGIYEKSPNLRLFDGAFLLSTHPLKTANWLQNTFLPDLETLTPGSGWLISLQSWSSLSIHSHSYPVAFIFYSASCFVSHLKIFFHPLPMGLFGLSSFPTTLMYRSFSFYSFSRNSGCFSSMNLYISWQFNNGVLPPESGSLKQ